MARSPTPRRFILAIETSNPSSWTPDSPVMPGVALAEASTPAVPIAAVACDPRQRDESLLEAINQAFARADASPGELARIAVSVGPGGFTALRVAVTVAKSLSLATGATTVAVPSALVAAWHAATTTPRTGLVGVALSSKADDAWLTVFTPDVHTSRSPVPSGRLIKAADIASLGLSRLIADHHLPASIRSAAAALGVPVEPPVFDPTMCLAAAEHLTEIDPLKLNLLYARMPEAVRKWRELHGEAAAPWPT